MPRSKGATVGGPWYDKSKDLWKVTDRGRSVTLRTADGEPVRGPNNRAAALRAAAGAPAAAPKRLTVAAVLDAYLDDVATRARQETVTKYEDIFTLFKKANGGAAAVGLHPSVLSRWLAGRRSWGPSARHLAGSAIKAAFAWAGAAGRGRLLPTNPLAGFRLPTVRRRPHDCVVTDAEFAMFLQASAANAALVDIMTVAWETGTRPVNLARAKFADFRPNESALVIPEHKTVGKTGRPLIIPLTAAALAVLYIRSKGLSGADLLFQTSTGLPWTATRLACMVMYYAARAGLKGRLTAYSCRHSVATRLLKAGASPVDVAAILGNTPAVVLRNYSHVAADAERLRRLLEGGGGGAAPALESS